MSRVIKFRAWHDGNEEMVNFNNSIVKKDHIQASYLAALMDGDFGDVLMQYIGLKDKNGTEIYTGDILSCRQESYHEVIFESYFATYKTKHLITGVVSDIYMDNMNEDFEVIGNIHQNPELLE